MDAFAPLLLMVWRLPGDLFARMPRPNKLLSAKTHPRSRIVVVIIVAILALLLSLTWPPNFLVQLLLGPFKDALGMVSVSLTELDQRHLVIACRKVLHAPRQYTRGDPPRLMISLMPVEIKRLEPSHVRQLSQFCLEIGFIPYATTFGYISCLPDSHPPDLNGVTAMREGLWYFNYGPK